MATPNFDAMTLEELDDWNVAKKAEIRALQAEYDSSNEVRARKVMEAHVAEARKQMGILADASGRSILEEAEFWQRRLDEGGSTGRWIQSNLVLGKPGREGIPVR